jgi:plastocyanin
MSEIGHRRVTHGVGRLAVTGLSVCVVLLTGVSTAYAGLGIAVSPGLPQSALVGQTNVTATMTVTNTSTAPQASGNVVLGAITLVPSCGSLSFGDCPAANVDFGVFQVSPTGVGEAGTACAGVTFSFTVIDPGQGKLRLDPSTPIVLGPTGGATGVCRIDFTIGVARLPAKDSDPAPGLQTAALAAASGTASDGSAATGFGSAETQVGRGTPGITTQVAAAALTLGNSTTDRATLTTSPGSPAPTGTVTFRVYGPSDPGCAGTPVATFDAQVTAGGAQSASFTPTAVGTYRFVASYGGDVPNNPVATACGDPGEAVVVKGQPAISTRVAQAAVGVGQAISDTATVIAGQGAPAPTGTVTFKIYGPSDATCAGTPASTVIANLSGGTATSSPPTFTADSTGTYRFVATYTGDPSNNPAGGSCGDAGESVTVGADEKPTAAYTPSTYRPAVGQTVSFDGRASGDPDGTIVTYRWVWGDGTPDGSGPTPTHVFTAATSGPRSVGLYVTDSDGQTAAVGHGITVGGDELPTAAYSPSTYNPAVGQTVSFDARASKDPDGTIVTYRWVWGDGTPDGSGPTPTHVFATEGLRSVALYITDSDGQQAAEAHSITTDEPPTAAYTPSTYTPIVGQTVSFDGRASNDPDGSIVTYRWVWGDGTPDGSGPTPTHVFAAPTTGPRSVGLYVTDSSGRTAAVGHGITVRDEQPTAAYTPSTYSPTVGQTVSFDGRASNDPDGTIVAYRWVWGDGTPDGSGSTATHVFTAPTSGPRSVGLYVTDSDGQTAAVGHGITVSGGA